jgi:hypothetical protein
MEASLKVREDSLMVQETSPRVHATVTGLLVSLALAALGCASNPPALPSGPVNQRVVLGPGETADVAGAAIGVRFESVVNDSRCPGDATCIQAGSATVRISVLPNGGGLVSYDVNTLNLPPTRHGDVTITLENLAPYPFASRPTAPSDYRATLRITRSQDGR